jgi:hypothetical protein
VRSSCFWQVAAVESELLHWIEKNQPGNSMISIEHDAEGPGWCVPLDPLSAANVP